ncbi:MAG: hypothetical protein RR538_09210 [Erysipelotrichaceae bacterium]
MQNLKRDIFYSEIGKENFNTCTKVKNAQTILFDKLSKLGVEGFPKNKKEYCDEFFDDIMEYVMESTYLEFCRGLRIGMDLGKMVGDEDEVIHDV